MTSYWTIAHNFGILQWLPSMSLWLYAVFGLLLLDFIGTYLVHFIEHKVKILWRFHLIHHTDSWIDTTSGNKHHPGESIIRFAFTILGVFHHRSSNVDVFFVSNYFCYFDTIY